jgi:hypothetical protein
VSAATQPDVRTPTRSHRAVLILIALAVAVATAVTLVVLGFTARTGPGAGSQTAVVHIPAVDDGCALARAGQPC